MKPSRVLESYLDIKRAAATELEALARIMADLDGLSIGMADRVSGTNDTDTISDRLAELELRRENLASLRLDLTSTGLRAVQIIDSIEQHKARDVMMRKYLLGESYLEISLWLDTSVGTVKSLVSRTKKRIDS